MIAALVVLAPAAAFAHDTWLLPAALPASLRVPVGRAVALDLTSGMRFPANETAIRPERVVRATVRLGPPGTADAPLGAPSSTASSLRYRWRPARAGAAAIAVQLAPRTLALAPRLVDEYLDEVDASPALRAEWARVPAPRQWRESYVKHAATFVGVGPVDVGAAAADTGWRARLGLDLEIVPERDPTTLRAGDTLPVRVWRGGAPLAGFALGARGAGEARARFVRTGADGRARVPLPRAGRWLLAGTDLRRVREPDLEWRSDFATVTLAVARRTPGQTP